MYVNNNHWIVAFVNLRERSVVVYGPLHVERNFAIGMTGPHGIPKLDSSDRRTWLDRVNNNWRPERRHLSSERYSTPEGYPELVRASMTQSEHERMRLTWASDTNAGPRLGFASWAKKGEHR
jgi:hypothetical protein